MYPTGRLREPRQNNRIEDWFRTPIAAAKLLKVQAVGARQCPNSGQHAACPDSGIR